MLSPDDFEHVATPFFYELGRRTEKLLEPDYEEETYKRYTVFGVDISFARSGVKPFVDEPYDSPFELYAVSGNEYGSQFYADRPARYNAVDPFWLSYVRIRFVYEVVHTPRAR
jgi:hypothetical protein